MRYAISGSSFVTHAFGAEEPPDALALRPPPCAREPGPETPWYGEDRDNRSPGGPSAIGLLADAVGRALAQAGLPRDGLRWAVIICADIRPPGHTGRSAGDIDLSRLEARLNEALRCAVPVLTIHGAGSAGSAIALAEDFLAAGAFDAVVSAATGTHDPAGADPPALGAPGRALGASALVVESFSQATGRGKARVIGLPHQLHGSRPAGPQAPDDRDTGLGAGGPELRRLPVRACTRPVRLPTKDRRAAGRDDPHAPREKAWHTRRNREATPSLAPPEVHVTLSNWHIPSMAQHELLWPALMDAARRGAAPVPCGGHAPPSAGPGEEAPALQLARRVLQPLLLPLERDAPADPMGVCGIIVAANGACADPDVAAALVRRYRLGPMSLNVASGSAASSDALALGTNAIRSGRLQRVLVLSVEFDAAGPRLACPAPDGAPAHARLAGAAVLLESTDSLCRRGGTGMGRIADCLFLHADSTDHHRLAELIERHADKVFYVGGDTFLRLALTALIDERRTRIVDFGDAAQRAHGLAGLLQLIAHCERRGAGADRRGAVIIGGGNGEDRRAVLLVIEPD